METLNNSYNQGIIQMLNVERKYSEDFKISNTQLPIEIYGKPVKWETELKNQFNIAKQNVTGLTNPIMNELKLSFGNDNTVTPMREIVQNINEYLDNLSQSFNNDIAMSIQEMVDFQQNYIQLTKKINLVSEQIDGKILENNLPRVYNLSGTTDVSKSSISVSDTLQELRVDYETLSEFVFGSPTNSPINSFNKLLSDYNLAFGIDPTYKTTANGCKFIVEKIDNLANDIDLNFYLLMSRVLTDKNRKDEFINFVLKGNIANYNTPVNLRNKFEKAVNNLEKIYSKELELEKKSFNEMKNTPRYKNLTDGITDIMYPAGKLRKFTYSTVPEGDEAAKKQKIIDLYRTKVIFN